MALISGPVLSNCCTKDLDDGVTVHPQQVCNQWEWLMNQMFVLPSRGTSKGLRNGPARKSWCSNKGKCRVLQLRKNTLMCQDTLGAAQTISRLAEQHRGQDTKLNTHPQCTLASSKVNNFLGCLRKSFCQQVKKDDPSLLTTGEKYPMFWI